eukprot:CAMPEP_0197603136 /NCGR_PEP_ID=MMETSP1326-20131121/38615_1 /TAXON_ID=1155430 /ORGANISM="Genus nov. species nov., Strain RCC2288" /LENGTH=59 /DNA_ID=CAMNT_0043170603 /DNA_START=349 /DNA_END=525 /DNA_ORIENTATION=+
MEGLRCNIRAPSTPGIDARNAAKADSNSATSNSAGFFSTTASMVVSLATATPATPATAA